MILIRRRPIGALAAVVLAVALAGCSSGRSREEREARINIFPENYKADLLAALHAYLSDPTRVRDAYLSEPALRPSGQQHRYTACVRFNAKNSDGRYVGSKDLLAVFVAGRFDQFIDPSLQQPGAGNQSTQANVIKEMCAQAEYQRFPELEAMTR
jgi:hypothetical protein